MKLNLGCGNDVRDGYVNVDYLDLPGVDVVHNLAVYPWPFDDGSAERIQAIDVVEHLPSHTQDLRPGVIAFVEECHRILMPHGRLVIQTPGAAAPFAWTDPTHVRVFTPESMDFFDPETGFGKKNGYYSQCKFAVASQVMENGNLVFQMVKL